MKNPRFECGCAIRLSCPTGYRPCLVVYLFIMLCVVFQVQALELGFYHVKNTAPHDKGADFIMSYQTVTMTFLDECSSVGLNVLVELPREDVKAIDPGDPNDPHLTHIETFITSLQTNGQDHAAIMGWYLYDEPEVWGVTPEQLLPVYHLIRKHSKQPSGSRRGCVSGCGTNSPAAAASLRFGVSRCQRLAPRRRVAAAERGPAARTDAALEQM